MLRLIEFILGSILNTILFCVLIICLALFVGFAWDILTAAFDFVGNILVSAYEFVLNVF